MINLFNFILFESLQWIRRKKNKIKWNFSRFWPRPLLAFAWFLLTVIVLAYPQECSKIPLQQSVLLVPQSVLQGHAQVSLVHKKYSVLYRNIVYPKSIDLFAFIKCIFSEPLNEFPICIYTKCMFFANF